MSKLQLALIGLGILIVAGIYLFNRWQERRYRSRAESAFQQRHADVLMNDTTPPPAPATRVRERIEPQFQAEEELPQSETPPASEPDMSGMRERITAELRADRRAEPRDNDAPPPAQPVAQQRQWDPEPAPSRATAAALESESDMRIEPHGVDNTPPAHSPLGADLLDYQLDLVSEAPISHSALDRALKQLSDLARRVRLWGVQDQQWIPVDMHGQAQFTRVRGTLQLVNRGGMVHQDDLVTFRRAFERCATEVNARLEAAEIEPFIETAQNLDNFCQHSDVLLGLSVIAQKSGPFAGTKVRAWAEAAGFQLRPSGVFELNDDHGNTAILMESHENPGFLPERIRTLTTKGVTLLLDVPRVSHGMQSFDKLVSLARHLATAMGGTLVDDNRAPVSEAGLDQIRTQLRKIYEDMDAHGIPAGGAIALRLFQ